MRSGQPGESYTETVLEDGTVVKKRRSVKYSHGPVEDMSGQGEVVPVGEVPRQEEEVEDTEEILPDGTVHHVHKVHRHSVKVVQKALRSEDGQEHVVEEKEAVPGSHSEELVETFKEKPRTVQQEEVVEEVLPDGTQVKRKILLNRLVSRTHTHQESFDEGSGGDRKVEDFEIDEVVPGTESAFLEGVDSSESDEDGDEELSMHKTTDVKETTEVLDDGTVVKKTLLTTEKSRKTRSRSGSVDRSETSTRVEEETVIPSPRPRSPVDGDLESESKDTVKTTTRTTHYEEEHAHGTVEKTLEMVEDMLARGALTEGSEGKLPWLVECILGSF